MLRKGLTDPPMQSSSYSEAKNQNYPPVNGLSPSLQRLLKKESWCDSRYPNSVAKYPIYPF